MSDWKFLNQHRIHEPGPTVSRRWVSTDAAGFNGLFRFNLDGKLIRCIASDTGGWQHVSVSIEYDKRCPSWPIMCRIKDLFWDPEDWVIQFHPAQSAYVNQVPGCLHLWRCTDGREQPIPPKFYV